MITPHILYITKLNCKSLYEDENLSNNFHYHNSFLTLSFLRRICIQNLQPRMYLYPHWFQLFFVTNDMGSQNNLHSFWQVNNQCLEAEQWLNRYQQEESSKNMDPIQWSSIMKQAVDRFERLASTTCYLIEITLD